MEKCDFQDFQKFSFDSQKTFFFSVQNIIKPYFQTCFDQKLIKKKFAFFDLQHGLTPLKKCHFWDFQNFLFLQSKKRFLFLYKVNKHFFQSHFNQIQIKKNLAFFDQKHGLTPLEKLDFWDFEKFCFCSKKKFLFYLEHY